MRKRSKLLLYIKIIQKNPNLSIKIKIFIFKFYQNYCLLILIDIS